MLKLKAVEPLFLKYPKDNSMKLLVDSKGKPLESIHIRLDQDPNHPLMIYTYPTSISLANEIYITFHSDVEERFFIQEIYFLLEEVNLIPTEARMSNPALELTYEQVLKGE